MIPTTRTPFKRRDIFHTWLIKPSAAVKTSENYTLNKTFGSEEENCRL